MLQDTLKSMIVSFLTVGAGLVFFWQQRHRRDDLFWHALLWLPLALMFYALGSMVWSHTYLAGVEAIRWFIFSLLLWLGINNLSRKSTIFLIEAIHWGAVVASLWAVLQFLVDFTYFPQGPNPGSTFVNRNFFAEFVVCTIPFSAYLLAQAKDHGRVTRMAFTFGLNITALMMTGTRGALAAMWILLAVILPITAVVYRKQFSFLGWDWGKRSLACGVLFTTLLVLGLAPTINPRLLQDSQSIGSGTNAFSRALKRTAAISPNDSSLGIRLVMWDATARIIKDKPLTGIGAGAWEAMVPLYQTEGTLIETDYYVHNEILQLLAEYGVTGLLFLIALTAYLLTTAWRTIKNRSPEGLAEAPVRVVALASLLALIIVSNIGFPWRMATTGCIFALSLAILGASDVRLHKQSLLLAIRLPWKPAYSQILFVLLLACMALTAYISQQAAATEQKIITAVKLALGISQLHDFNDPQLNKSKNEVVKLVKEGVAINTHYRKITPMVADELAKWEDWQNAIWVWESVVASRPYIVVIMSNIARSYAHMGQNEKALEYLARCEKLQPKAASLRSLKVILMSRTGQDTEAALLARRSMEEGVYDYDLVTSAYDLGLRQGDLDMAIKGLELRNKGWPDSQANGLFQLGIIYASGGKDDIKALASFKAALAATPAPDRKALLQKIPLAYQSQL